MAYSAEVQICSHVIFLEAKIIFVNKILIDLKDCLGESINHSVMTNTLRPHGLLPPQAPLTMEFSRQEYWIGQPFPSPGDLPDPGIEPRSLALQADSLPSELPGKP